MQAESSGVKGLPENAYKELAPGEEYQPIIPASATPAEVTPWSVAVGLFMAVLFSAAAAYSGLKIGQVFEAAIPIAILAVGLSTVFRRESALSQNVIIQSIGACSGVIVAGAVFTIPALYILKLPVSFFQLFGASALGGVLGVLFLIPFRRYFVKDMHGTLPFPEATATTEILVAGEKGGDQAKVLVVAGLVGGLFEFAFNGFKLFSEVVTTRMVDVGQTLADKLKLVGKLNVSAMIFGLGYIVGLRYSAIIVAGSLLSWFVLVPLVYYVGADLKVILLPGKTLIANMSAEEIFKSYVRQIGIGGIAMAGVVGIIRSWRIIVEAFGLAVKEIFHKKADSGVEAPRTQRDLGMLYNVAFIAFTIVLLFGFFRGFVVTSLMHALVGVAIVVVISFLFTTVAANAIAIVGSNPVSGMTLMTLIASSFVLVKVGLKGDEGMVSALLIGGVVCTALSVAGGFITDLKIGYWIGTTPRNQEIWKFLGILVSAATVGYVIFVLNQACGFGEGKNALAAPQANAMAAVIQPLMSDQPAPWLLYLVGALISLILVMIGIPPLAFALGMYLPQDLNTPLIVGGLIAWLSTSRSTDEKLNNARFSRGTLIASGFIASASIFGVLNAFLRYREIDPAAFVGRLLHMDMEKWVDSNGGQIVALVMFIALVAYTWWDTMRATPEEDQTSA